MKKLILKGIVYTILFTVLLTGCGGVPAVVQTPTHDNCSSKELEKSISILKDFEEQMEDLKLLADNTSPDDFDPVLKELREINTEIKSLDLPFCSLRAKDALVGYIDSEVKCIMYHYAMALYENNEIDHIETDQEGKPHYCDLASSQFDYYMIQMEKLEELLQEKSEAPFPN